MSNYDAAFARRFSRNLQRYAGMRKQIQARVDRILENPYENTEILTALPGQVDLRGCRSARIDRNFRLIFVICTECRNVPECQFCFCEGLHDQTVVFLTVGPHDRAYEMQ